MEHDTFVKLIYDEFKTSGVLTESVIGNCLRKAYPNIYFSARYRDVYPTINTFKSAVEQINSFDGKVELESMRVLWTALRPELLPCCAHVFKTGKNKGSRCPKATVGNSGYCKAHDKEAPKCSGTDKNGKPCKRRILRDGKCSAHWYEDYHKDYTLPKCSYRYPNGNRCEACAVKHGRCTVHQDPDHGCSYRYPNGTSCGEPVHMGGKCSFHWHLGNTKPRSAEPDTHPLASEVKRILNTPIYSIFTGSADAIRKEYKRLALIFHPDKCNHPKASEVFSKIAMAYEKYKK
jgi:hypothetical protein